MRAPPQPAEKKNKRGRARGREVLEREKMKENRQKDWWKNWKTTRSEKRKPKKPSNNTARTSSETRTEQQHGTYCPRGKLPTKDVGPTLHRNTCVCAREKGIVLMPEAVLAPPETRWSACTAYATGIDGRAERPKPRGGKTTDSLQR